MNTISVKINQPWLSLQEGFEWENIPSFAIITGVNGIGKTHLVKLLKNDYLSQDPLLRLLYQYNGLEIIDSPSQEKIKLVLPISNNNQNISGLLVYYRNINNRLARLAEIENNIESNKNLIVHWTSLISQTNNKGQKLANESNSIRNSNNIIELQKEKELLIIYAYEEELKNIAQKLGKNIEDLSETDINQNANPFFNHLVEINDFQDFIKQNESKRNENILTLAKEKDYYAVNSLVDSQKTFEKINELFSKFEFHYYTMDDPFPKDKSKNGEISFTGKRGEIISYESLSNGEQMIVKFIIWAMGKDVRGHRINTMILDEPDSHLHPKMCKMMVDILSEISKPKEEGGSGIRVIITTHSPSTVAFAPEGSLFVMEKDESNNRKIRLSSTKEAMDILSEGIFTYDKAIGSLTLISETSKKSILCVEGKTDVAHIKHAMDILNRDIDIEVVDVHDAGNLANFIKSTPAKPLGNKKIIALFDCDEEGKKAYRSIPGDEKANYKQITAHHCNGKSFLVLLPPPDNTLEKYCPIEYLYSKNFLEQQNIIEKLEYGKFRHIYNLSTINIDNDKELISEFENNSSLRPFKVKDGMKNNFASSINQYIDPKIFANFNPLFDIIENIISS